MFKLKPRRQVLLPLLRWVANQVLLLIIQVTRLQLRRLLVCFLYWKAVLPTLTRVHARLVLLSASDELQNCSGHMR